MCFAIQNVRAARLFIYLNTTPLIAFYMWYNQEKYYDGQSIYPVLVAARVALHPRGVRPNMKLAAAVSPGHDTTFLVSSTKRQRLPPPYGTWQLGATVWHLTAQHHRTAPGTSTPPYGT